MSKVVRIDEHERFCQYAEMQQPRSLPYSRYDRFTAWGLTILLLCSLWAGIWMFGEWVRGLFQ